jgi:glycerophosphoryl diester phosphodiesterase
MPAFSMHIRLVLTLAIGLAVHVSEQPVTTAAAAPTGTFVIAHRGASAYAPEHTAAAYRLAIEQGADYVEPDLGITRDGVFVCTHDGTLERTTNVRERFPDRFTDVKVGATDQRHWLVESFTLAEIKSLDAGSWFGAEFKGARMMTLQETIDLVKGKAGLFPELKVPSRFRAKGFDPEQMVADALRKNGLVGTMVKGRPAVHMQVFEEDSVRRLARVLPEVPRSLLIGSPEGVTRWLNPAGLAELKTFATGIAPAYQIVDRMPEIVPQAHAVGLTVVPYTFTMRPPGPATRDALTAQIRTFIATHKVDGLFTDNPDLFPR